MVMKILIIGGTHGDEKTGIDVVSRIRREPIVDIDIIIANPRAVKAGCRYIETDLNRSFGNKVPQSYEERRAARIIPTLKRYDIVVEFHNTTSRTTCAIITNENPTEQQLAVAAHFGLKYVVIMPPGHSLSSQCPCNTVSLEISNHNKKLIPHFLVGKIKTIKDGIVSSDVAKIKLYYHKGVKVMVAQLAEVGLSTHTFSDFFPIPKKVANLLNLEAGSVPFLMGEKAYGENFAFNVAERIKKGRRKKNGGC